LKADLKVGLYGYWVRPDMCRHAGSTDKNAIDLP